MGKGERKRAGHGKRERAGTKGSSLNKHDVEIVFVLDRNDHVLARAEYGTGETEVLTPLTVVGDAGPIPGFDVSKSGGRRALANAVAAVGLRAQIRGGGPVFGAPESDLAQLSALLETDIERALSKLSSARQARLPLDKKWVKRAVDGLNAFEQPVRHHSSLGVA